jgi:hypothetical protein
MLGDIYARVKQGSKNEDQRNYWGALSGKVYALIVEQYPLSPRAQDAKARLKQMGLPVPPSNPDAVIRMQKERDYEKQHHQNALLKAPKEMLHGAPDVSLAAHVGQPNLNPPDDAVAASEVLKPNSGAGFTLSGSASGTGVTDSSASANSTGPTKQEDAVTSQGTIESGSAPGRTLGIQIIQPPDASAPPSANTGTAGTNAPAAAATPSTPQPTANSADAPGTAPAAATGTSSTAASPSAPTGSNGQPAGTQAAGQTDQSSTDSTSSSTTGQSAAQAQSSSTDDSKDSSSKKKKGVRKLVPW